MRMTHIPQNIKDAETAVGALMKPVQDFVNSYNEAVNNGKLVESVMEALEMEKQEPQLTGLENQRVVDVIIQHRSDGKREKALQRISSILKEDLSIRLTHDIVSNADTKGKISTFSLQKNMRMGISDIIELVMEKTAFSRWMNWHFDEGLVQHDAWRIAQLIWGKREPTPLFISRVASTAHIAVRLIDPTPGLVGAWAWMLNRRFWDWREYQKGHIPYNEHDRVRSMDHPSQIVTAAQHITGLRAHSADWRTLCHTPADQVYNKLDLLGDKLDTDDASELIGVVIRLNTGNVPKTCLSGISKVVEAHWHRGEKVQRLNRYSNAFRLYVDECAKPRKERYAPIAHMQRSFRYVVETIDMLMDRASIQARASMPVDEPMSHQRITFIVEATAQRLLPTKRTWNALMKWAAKMRREMNEQDMNHLRQKMLDEQKEVRQWHSLVGVVTIGNYVARPLTNAIELLAEGSMMRHCIGDNVYSYNCYTNKYRLFSIRASVNGRERTGYPIANILLYRETTSGTWLFAEAKGHRNREVDVSVVDVGRTLAEMYNEAEANAKVLAG